MTSFIKKEKTGTTASKKKVENQRKGEGVKSLLGSCWKEKLDSGQDHAGMTNL